MAQVDKVMNNENQAMEVVKEQKKENFIQKVSNKKADFEAKHPVASKRIKTGVKVLGIAGAIAGAFAVGKVLGDKHEDDDAIEVQAVELPTFDEEILPTPDTESVFEDLAQTEEAEAVTEEI